MTNYIAVEEESIHYKTFLHWDDDDEPRVTIFTDMVDPEEGRPRLENMFSFIQVPCALITNWDRSGESESQFEILNPSCTSCASTMNANTVRYSYCTSTSPTHALRAAEVRILRDLE